MSDMSGTGNTGRDATSVARRPTLPAWNQPAPEWLSLQQAASIYGVSVDTLRRRIAAGKLPASRFGVRVIRVRAEDVDRLYRRVPIGDQLARWRRS